MTNKMKKSDVAGIIAVIALSIVCFTTDRLSTEYQETINKVERLQRKVDSSHRRLMRALDEVQEAWQR